MAPAKTGRERSRRIAVINTDQTNIGTLSILMEIRRMFKIVVIKLIAPKIEEAPAMWSEKITKSTEEPL